MKSEEAESVFWRSKCGELNEEFADADPPPPASVPPVNFVPTTLKISLVVFESGATLVMVKVDWRRLGGAFLLTWSGMEEK